ncbi:MAG: hypothetical protein COU11_00125 [Candidatus Harrisonbacteria bacterium CG10_big_fil_rev_8_21_14_0_10_49_15]|uniref:YdbS-like PH domain-containing protein n=1 Tax=Candidatus Harrisonbacteria bacterium CG10_big_fil_rev_8_21_14_0_10_49_15 TaxID=1974587 RepID=A0A2H0UPB3_9BACT|nr:MAG: hypothetical protein COU11_00125 [Candidatus Harrisonbacteria bacterium CG10_big_fil_rev_8_21_14_0_10_49_15]
MHLELHPDEKIIMRQRKHWFVFALEAVGFGIGALVPIVLVPSASWLFPGLYEFFGTADTFALLVFASGAWFLLLWILLSVAFTNYYLDVLIVTTKRMLDLDQRGLFSRDVATIPSQNIQDIKIDTQGIFATFFNFGDLHVQTAGGHKELVIRGIKDPEHVKDEIMGVYHNISVSTSD